MYDQRIAKLADLMVNYSVAVQPKQKVIIRGSTLAEPLVKEVYKKVLEAGAYPLVWVNYPDLNDLFFKYANEDQLTYIHEPLKYVFENYDVLISLGAESNTKSSSHTDPARMTLQRKAMSGIMKTYMERSATGALKWTLTIFPTNAYAQDAEMSLEEYTDFVYNACMPDMNDPVGYWKRFSAKQQKIVEWMKGKKNVHVTAPGTDLRLSVEGRTFINCDCKENVPDGEIFTGPVEDSVEGHVHFTYPAIYSGREVTNARLWFEKGKCVKATADKNEEFLNNTLDTDAGSRYVGEFAIGTNEGINRFTGSILYDEKIGGSFHMALGAGYPETGSTNESGLHWDMICDLRNGGQITVDDVVLYKNGKFVIDL
ncbi:MAG: aminopeptidase [Anaerolineaceae bacterium]|nr:aminopeptidase [Anaerolineaceae bacterium]